MTTLSTWYEAAPTPGTVTLGADNDLSSVRDWAVIAVSIKPGAGAGNAAPTVSLTSPANNATFTAPASIVLTADAQDTDGTVAQVKFFQGGTLVATDTAAPFTFTLTNVAAGSYTFTARATDNLGASTTSAAVSVTVNAAVAQMYFIHTDHLNSPRLITNSTGQAVWRSDNTDPFGGNVPDENPSGLGAFTCNLRLPGQYFDQETNTHYNYFRDYDPGIGRYVQSDSIGLAGGINTYLYVGANPIKYYDLFGLDRWGDQQVDPWYPRSKKPPFHVRPDGQPWGWGCGDKDTDHVVPDVMWGVNVTPACRKHDHCYERACEPGVTKERCDDDFFKDVRSACRQAGKPEVVCYQLAKSYYDGVRRGGGPSFEAEKKKCCK